MNKDKRNNIEEKTNLIYKILSENNSFLSYAKSIKDIQQKARKECNLYIPKLLLSKAFLLFPFNDYKRFADIFRKIADNYKIFTLKI